MSLPRRALRVAALVAVVALAYGGGVVTGVVGSSQHAAKESSRDVLDEAADRILNDSVNQVSRSELQRAAVEGMLRALGDKWSSYYAPGEFTTFQAVLEGRYSGVGLWVRLDDDGAVRVSSVQPGSPAARAKIASGDELLAIGGRSVTGRTIADVASDLRGDAHTSVSLTFRHGESSRTVDLRRTALDTTDVSSRSLSGSVLLIKVSAFTRGVSKQVRTLVAEASSHHQAVVLDLRDNPGGLLDEAVQTASVFLDGGTVVAFQRRGEPELPLMANGSGDTRIPLAVLVDGATASAAEVVAGALQDRNRAVIVGSRTYGKGSVQDSSRLSDGSGLELTIGHYVTPSGRVLDGVGIDPDVVVPDGSSPSLAEFRAVDVLSGVLADRGSAGRG